ncbi:putative Fe-Mo cluster-binding NifX family protein [Paraburkholderia sp. 40]
MEVVYDLDRRREYQKRVEAERQAQHDAKQEALAVSREIGIADGMKALVAVATKGGGRVNEHFGHVTEFQIFEVSAAEALFVGHRRVDLYCLGGYGDDEQLPSVVRALHDCHAVLVAKIGACPKDELAQAGIEPVDQYVGEFIEKAVLAWFNDYRSRIASGAIVHRDRGDASIRQGAYTSSASAA